MFGKEERVELLDLPYRASVFSGTEVLRVSESTANQYRNAINKLTTFLDSGRFDVTTLDELSPEILAQYIQFIEETCKVGYANNLKSQLRTMFNVERRGDLTAILRTKQAPPIARALKDSTFQKLVALPTRDLAILYVLRYTGVRRQSITRMLTKNVQFVHDGFLVDIVEKGDRPRIVGSSNLDAAIAFKRWFDVKPDSHDSYFVFTDFKTGGQLSEHVVSHIIRRVARACWLDEDEKANPHAFRHRWCQEMLDEFSPGVVSDISGNSVKTLLSVYDKRDRDEIVRTILGEEF